MTHQHQPARRRLHPAARPQHARGGRQPRPREAGGGGGRGGDRGMWVGKRLRVCAPFWFLCCTMEVGSSHQHRQGVNTHLSQKIKHTHTDTHTHVTTIYIYSHLTGASGLRGVGLGDLPPLPRRRRGAFASRRRRRRRHCCCCCYRSFFWGGGGAGSICIHTD